MTMKLRLVPRAVLTAKVSPRPPASIVGTNGDTSSYSGGVWTIGPDYSSLVENTSIVAAKLPHTYFRVYDDQTLSYARTNLTTILAAISSGLDPTLVSIAALSPTADQGIYFTGADVAATFSLTSFGRSLVDDADATAARATLGLVIGSNVQAYDAELAAIAGLTSAANKIAYFTGSGTAALADYTAQARAIDALGTTAGLVTITGSGAATVRSLVAPVAGITVTNPAGAAGDLTLVLANDLAALEALSGTNTIYYRSAADTWTAVTIGGMLSFSGGTLNVGDAELTALAGLTSAADKLPYFTGSGTAALADFPSAARTFFTTPSSANLASLVSDETGSGALVFASAPTLTNPVVGTQTPGDNTTKAASTAFVQAAIVASGGGDMLSTNNLSDVADVTTARHNLAAAPYAAMALNNVVVNPAIDVSQELGTTGATLVNNTAKYTADCLEGMYNHGAATAVVTCGQIAAASFGSALPGFRFGHQLKATTAISSPANGDFAKHRSKIEGYRIAHWGWGASGALDVVVAFQYYSTASGTAFVKLSNSDQSRCYYHEITVAAGWNFYAFTLAGDTTGTWQATTSAGLVFEVFSSGKETTPQSTLDAWGTGNKVQTTNSTNLLGTNNNLTVLTGLYIAAGTQLPASTELPRLMRSFEEEERRCMRYYETLSLTSVNLMMQAGTTTQAYGGQWLFKVRKATAPTGSTSGSFNVYQANTTEVSITPSFNALSVDGAWINGASASGLVAGNAAVLKSNSAGTLIANARL